MATTSDYFNTAYDYVDYNETMGEEHHPCHDGRPADYFVPALYSVMFVVGLSGNALVLWVILSGARLRSMTDVCLLNLAVADILLLSSLPFQAHQVRRHWVFGDAMCKVVMGTYYVGFYAGIFFVTLMSVDRYLAIVHAVLARGARTSSFGALAAGVTWVAGFLASFPEAGLLQEQRHKGTVYCEPSYERSSDGRLWWRVFGLFKMNVLGLAVPAAIVIFCYGQIVRTLLASQWSKKQAIRLIATVVAVFLCCWVPFNITCFFEALHLMHVYTSCDRSRHIQVALQVTKTIAYGHSCVNPILYVFVGERFRKQLLRLISRSPCMLCPLIKRCMPPQERFAGSVFSQSTSLNERSTVV